MSSDISKTCWLVLKAVYISSVIIVNASMVDLFLWNRN